MNKELMDHAKQYVERGWRLIPTAPVTSSCNGKRPFLARWQDSSTLDLQRVESWIRKSGNVGIGIVTGECSGLLVLDEDPRNGGTETLVELKRRYGKLPDTPIVETGGGGRHYYFRHPAGLDRTPKTLGPGLDLKGNNGFVVAPPTMHASGNRYQWDGVFHFEAHNCAEIPAWFFRHIKNERNQLLDTIQSAFEHLIFHEGQRNERLTSIYGKLLSKNVDPDLAFNLISALNECRCKPPLPDEEVLALVISISKRELEYRKSSSWQPI